MLSIFLVVCLIGAISAQGQSNNAAAVAAMARGMASSGGASRMGAGGMGMFPYLAMAGGKHLLMKFQANE
jgi:hypothetical protein